MTAAPCPWAHPRGAAWAVSRGLRSPADGSPRPRSGSPAAASGPTSPPNHDGLFLVSSSPTSRISLWPRHPPPESPPVATDCGLAVWSPAACPGMFQPHPPEGAGSKTGSRCRSSLGRSSRPVLAGCLWWCWWRKGFSAAGPETKTWCFTLDYLVATCKNWQICLAYPTECAARLPQFPSFDRIYRLDGSSGQRLQCS